ncbi:MAG: hypothetical protein R3F50_15570 [Gammaproteobacteria bacterium]|jgi:hypothetical protein
MSHLAEMTGCQTLVLDDTLPRQGNIESRKARQWNERLSCLLEGCRAGSSIIASGECCSGQEEPQAVLFTVLGG